MKKILFFGVFLFLGTFVLFAQTVTAVNQSGETIVEMYISVADTEDWEEDILPGTLTNGQSVNIKLPHSGTWDFLAVGASGNQYYVLGVSIPPVNRINITR